MSTATTTRPAHATVTVTKDGQLAISFYSKARRDVESMVKFMTVSDHRGAWLALRGNGIKSERVHWLVHPNAIPGEAVENLTDVVAEGDVFSVDGGDTWYVCAVNMTVMGTVAVYCNHRRTDGSPTVRVNVDSGSKCLIKVR